MENLTVDKSKRCQIYRNFFTNTNKQLFVNLNLFQVLQESCVIFETFDETYWQKGTLHLNFGNFFAKEIQLNSDGFHAALPKTQLICEKLPTVTQTSEIYRDDDLMDFDDNYTKTIDTTVEESDKYHPEQTKTFKDATVQTAFSVLVADSQCQCDLGVFKDSICAQDEHPKQLEEVDSFRSLSLILNEKANDKGAELPLNHGKIDFETTSTRKKSKLKTTSRIRIGLSKHFKPRPLHNK